MTSTEHLRVPPDAREAFAELGRIPLREHSVESVLQRVAELARDVVPGAAEVSVTLMHPDRPETVVFTGSLAVELDERQYAGGRGPCLDAAVGGETLVIRDARTETRWPDYTPAARERGALSSMSLPLPVQGQVTAALNVYALAADAFDSDSVVLGEAFASYAAVAVANMQLYEDARLHAEQLTFAMESRSVIEQAKGVVMGTRRCTPSEAFDVLVLLAQSSKSRLRDVAREVVSSASRPER